jgi:hypothetical protein
MVSAKSRECRVFLRSGRTFFHGDATRLGLPRVDLHLLLALERQLRLSTIMNQRGGRPTIAGPATSVESTLLEGIAVGVRIRSSVGTCSGGAGLRAATETTSRSACVERIRELHSFTIRH